MTVRGGRVVAQQTHGQFWHNLYDAQEEEIKPQYEGPRDIVYPHSIPRPSLVF